MNGEAEKIRNTDPATMQRARQLRKKMSPPEKMLWSRLRAGKIGFVVRRKYAIGPYVADFYVHELSICIEVDGKGHENREQEDHIRNAFFKKKGITTIRISAKRSFEDLDGVVESLYFGLRECAGLKD
jgi:very-short-patch-repair endonuclease